MHKFWFFLLFLGSMLQGIAQVKYEAEERIQLSEVPINARNWIEACVFPKKVKWYRETNLVDHTIEAKTKYQRRLYSIEFDSTGQIKDVELTVKLKDVDVQEMERLHKALQESFEKYKIVKLQKHWEPKGLGEARAAIKDDLMRQEVPFYEVVVKAKKQKALFEVFIKSDGTVLRKEKIISRLSDNLEF